MPSDSINIAQYLPRMARSHPDQRAIVVSRRRGANLMYCSLTFAELETLSNRYANALGAAGIGRGMRTLLMVRQGFDFVAVVFALFKMGAAPVLIDPGMGVARLLDCIRTVKLDAFVGIPLAHAVRALRPGPFASVKKFVTVGRRWFWGGANLERLTRNASEQFEMVQTAANETAAILFTSGSTGPAKGVVYEHGMFDAQVRRIQTTYGIQPGEIDLPTFPLFALFSVAMGMTLVLPDMDPSHPARVNPRNVIDAIRDQKVTNTFGSPALWKRVSAYCVERGVTLPTVRRILIAGAPVPPQTIEQLHRVLPADADVHTPYGATESLPVSTISGHEIVGWAVPTKPEPRPSVAGRAVPAECRVHLDAPPTVALTLRGAGTCVGRPVAETRVRIIRITDEPIVNWSDDVLAQEGEIGEICVAGPSVTRAYFGLPHANATSKIRDGDMAWHRIGDVGYFDELGRLWFCGRKAHRVTTQAGTLFTECIEPVFNRHPAIARCALVGVGPPGRQLPVLVVEPKPGHSRRGRRATALASEILAAANQYRHGVQALVVANQYRPDVHRDQGAGLGSDPPATRGNNLPQLIANQQWKLFQSQISDCNSQISILKSTIDPDQEHRGQSTILFHRSLPVDIRHNAKINRELLGSWASKRFGNLTIRQA